MTKSSLAGIDEQRTLWNDWLGSHQMQAVSPHHRARGKYAVEMLRSLGLAEPRILEVGCANGWLTQVLTTIGPTTGTDLSDVAVAAAARAVPGARFVAGDFLTVDVGPTGFDVIICLETIAYLDQAAFVQRAATLLQPAGYLIVSTPNWPIWTRSGWGRGSSSRIGATHLSIAGIRTLLSPSFDVLKCTTILTEGMGGHDGIFRVINSPKLNACLRWAVGSNRLETVRGRFGLGETIFVLARPSRH